MGGVLCSAIVSERLKMRNSLGISYWQDTISGVKVNNNVININKLWGVSTSFVIFHFNTNFFNSSKMEINKNLGGDCSPPAPSVSTGLCLQDVLKMYHKVKLFLLTRLRDVFNTFLRRTAKKVIYRRICLRHTSEKSMISVQNLQEWSKFLEFCFSLYYTL